MQGSEGDGREITKGAETSEGAAAEEKLLVGSGMGRRSQGSQEHQEVLDGQ